MRRIVAVLVALAAVGAAVASVRGVDEARFARARAEAQRIAETLRTRTEDAVGAQVHRLEARAQLAAARPELRNALATIRGEDGSEGGFGAAISRTLEDGIRTEPWWEPFRRELPITALSVTTDRIDLAVGITADDLAADVLIRRARESGVASDVIIGKGWPYAAAAERIPLPNLKTPAVLLLAKPLDQTVIKEVSERVGSTIVLSNGKQALVEAGPEAARKQLASVIGKETSTEPVGDPAGTWAAASRPLAPGLWLWIHAGATASSEQAEHTAGATRAAIWAGALLLAAVSLFIGFRRARPRASDEGVVHASVAAPVGSTTPGLGPTSLRSMPGSDADADAHLAISPHAATVAAVSPSASSSRVFGRYALVDRLGEGGMAQVFTAVTFGAEGFRRRFVVKRLRPELAQDPTVVSQFIDEAKLGSSLVHSNVIPVFDFGKVGDEYFLATEYILGRDLMRFAQRSVERLGRGLPGELVLYIAHETLKALDYAHTKVGEGGRPLQLVHRDVSPSNVLVSARGEVKLFDFGIVKAEGRVTRTEQGVVKGNVTFMAPEQARGAQVDARTDLYSLGLVMYCCLAGEPLYRGNTTYELLLKAATGVGASELERLRALPPPLAALIERALAVDPAGRYPSAAAFAAAIAPHLRAGAADLAALMQELFGDEFRAEEARFAAAAPMQDPSASSDAVPATGRKTGTRLT